VAVIGMVATAIVRQWSVFACGAVRAAAASFLVSPGTDTSLQSPNHFGVVLYV
jgi:hypothetical protein